MYEKQYLASANRPLPATWTDAGSDAVPIRCGGRWEGLCRQCNGPLSHLLTLDPIPADLGINSVRKLRVVTCLRCVSSTPSYFQHSSESDPGILQWAGPYGGEEFQPLLPLEGRMTILDPRWRTQSAGSSHNLNRVGGPPAWVQYGEYPDCITCSHPMGCIAQLGSDFPAEDDDGFLWGSGGILYIYWCDRCSVSAQLFQCT